MLSAIERRTSGAFLSKGRWFGSLPASLRRAMLDVAEKRRFDARQMLYHVEGGGRGFWMLLQGQVMLADTFVDGRRFVYHVGGPGYCFGGTAADAEVPAMMEVCATTQVQALVVPAPALQRILAAEPDYYKHFTRLVATRCHAVMRCFSHSRTLAPEAYLRFRLALLAELWRQDGYDEPVIELALSQAETAHLLGISRQTLNRYLARLESEGLVEVGFCTLRILQHELLGDGVASLSA